MSRRWGVELRHVPPPTVDRARRRLWIIAGLFCIASCALIAVIVLKLAGVVE